MNQFLAGYLLNPCYGQSSKDIKLFRPGLDNTRLFLRDQASDSEEVVTPLMLDGTYLSRNFATLGPLT